MKKILNHPLFFPLMVGFLLRFSFLFVSQHIYHPDELYQSLEQAFRIVNGYGIMPWDFVYGLRSYVLPLLLAIPLYLAKAMGIEDPSIYRFFPQILLVLLSLLPIAAIYTVTRKLNKSVAVFAAFFAAIWYELIYFSGRALTEVVAVDFFALAVLFLFAKRPKVFLATACIGIATLLRLQYFPIALILLYLTPKKPSSFFGIFTAVIIFGLVDQLYLGSFLSHPFTNIMVSFASGISEGFGTQGVGYYFRQILFASSGLWLVALYRREKNVLIWLSLLSIIVLHSLIAHKEYRFIYVTIPLLIVLTSIAMRSFQKGAAVIICILSLLGILGRLPGQYNVYGQPPLLKDPEMRLYSSLFTEKNLCGIYDQTRNWAYTPGAFFLNRNVPLYSYMLPPTNPNAISHIITTDPDLDLGGFIKISTTESYDVYLRGNKTTLPGISLYQKITGSCEIDSHYSTYRSFPKTEAILTQINAEKR